MSHRHHVQYQWESLFIECLAISKMEPRQADRNLTKSTSSKSWRNLKWSELTPLNPPTPRSHHICLQRDGKLYLFGGSSPKNVPLGDLYCYDPATNSWQRLDTANEGPKRSHSAGVFIGSKLYIIGGYWHMRFLRSYSFSQLGWK